MTTPRKKPTQPTKSKFRPLVPATENLAKDKTAIESLNDEYNHQNDNFCALIERVESVTNKLRQQIGNGSTKEKDPEQIPGLLTEYANHIGRQAILLSRLDITICNLEQLV